MGLEAVIEAYIAWEWGLKVGIWASRQGLGPQGWALGWDLGIEAEIWALRLGFKHQG